MRRFLTGLVLLLAPGIPKVISADETGPAKDIPELQILQNDVGAWDVQVTGNEFTRGEETARWILNGLPKKKAVRQIWFTHRNWQVLVQNRQSVTMFRREGTRLRVSDRNHSTCFPVFEHRETAVPDQAMFPALMSGNDVESPDALPRAIAHAAESDER